MGNIALLLMGLTAAMPFVYWIQAKVAFGVFFVTFLMSSLLYLALNELYVVELPPDKDGVVELVVRGNKRPDLKEPFSKWDDEHLVEETGVRDRNLHAIYTRESLVAHHLLLFGPYLLTFMSFELLCSSLAKSIKKKPSS